MKRPVCEFCGAATRRKRAPNGLLRCRREARHRDFLTVALHVRMFLYVGKHLPVVEYPKTWGLGEPPRYPIRFGPMVGDGPVKTSAWVRAFEPKHLLTPA